MTGEEHAMPDPISHEEYLRNILSEAIERALGQVHPTSTESTTDLKETIAASVVFPNSQHKPKQQSSTNPGSLIGKPYNIELRIGLKLFHQWKREQIMKPTAEDEYKSTEECNPKKSKKRKKDRMTCASTVTITSDLGLSRNLSSPFELAEMLAPLLEEDIGNHPHWGLAPDVRCQPSGVMSLITDARVQELRNELGMLPCPHCIKWCKGEKGLWWHQQLHHQQEHAAAAAVAQATGNHECAIVVYEERSSLERLTSNITQSATDNSARKPCQRMDPFDCIRDGDLAALQRVIGDDTFIPSTTYDRKGATPLMWAAGGGHLQIVQYLVERCDCDPSQIQKGKRSFAGRTALHWAARNGHRIVVEYLVSTAQSESRKMELIEAATQDGTTAFGWACWQRHLDVMEYLYQQGCAIDKVNTFGCSPVLWCSQGVNGDGLKALQWLQARGCNMKRINNNGHGVLHKSAQRGQQNVVEWFVEEILTHLIEPSEILLLIGPDTEGYCPSDLAGMEGHSNLAVLLAKVEVDVSCKLKVTPDFAIPDKYGDGHNLGNQVKDNWVWERYGGLRRMKSSLSRVS